MKPILLAALLCAATVNAQHISITPSNYSLTIITFNNHRTWWFDDLRTNTVDRFELGQRKLTRTHTVFFDSAFMGTKWGGPKLLEDRIVYRQIGAASYVGDSGQQITFFAPSTKGGWIASTNFIASHDIAPIEWLPGMVGTVTFGDAYARVVTTASDLVCHGRNLMNAPWLLRIRCVGVEDWEFLLRFEANQRRQFTIGLNGLEAIVFDLDEAREEAL